MKWRYFIAATLVGLSTNYHTSAQSVLIESDGTTRHYFGLFIGINSNRVHGGDDADRFARAVTASPTNLIDDSKVTRLTGQVHVDQIRTELNRIARLMRPRDVLVLYFSGHGGLAAVPGENEKRLLLQVSGPGGWPDSSASFFPMWELDQLRDLLRGCEVWLILDGCFAGPQTLLREAIPGITVSALTCTKDDEFAFEGFQNGQAGGVFSLALTQVLEDPRCDLDGDGLVSLEELHNEVYRRTLQNGGQDQHLIGGQNGQVLQYPSVAGTRIHRQYLIRGYPPSSRSRADTSSGPPQPPRVEFRLSFEDGQVPRLLAGAKQAFVNQELFNVEEINDANHSITLSARVGHIRTSGLLRIGPVGVGLPTELFWCDGGAATLSRLCRKLVDPYPLPKAHAVVVSIGDYYEKMKNGSFKKIDNVTASTDDLISTFKGLGFECDRPLREADATTIAIKERLLEYYPKGSNGNATCLVFYFLGHGHLDTTTGIRYLVTADFDPNRPEVAGIDLQKLVEWLRGVSPAHVLFVLDACQLGADNTKSFDRNATPDLGYVSARSALFKYSDGSRCLLTATKGNQNANTKAGSGLLSRYIVDALRWGQADEKDRGAFTTKELYEHLSGEIQKYQSLSPEQNKALAEQEPGIMWFTPLDNKEKEPKGQLVFLLSSP
jgi:hypothetical protein